ncbi:hypothetical protein B0H17DRAFT_227562 [Mycena rosella]|uniref:Uncharacterized protein n=1 Tax=Mycena rosella TaxID=1033263 RepID=A0AAD7H192_MYCRO|nr:hypothetical protein B0H17DRAFT_227562 [Mycena rosella]
MESKKSKTREGRKHDPLLPRAVCEQFRTKFPQSVIFAPFFADVRHEMLTRHMDRTSLEYDEAPGYCFNDRFPQVLKAAYSERSNVGGSWLHVAVRETDLPLAHECVRLGTRIQLTDRRGYSALYLGCIILKDLLLPDGPVTTHLHLFPGRTVDKQLAPSLASQILELCLFLLGHHADPNEMHNGLSLLGLACLAEQWELIRTLILHGARSSPSSTPPNQLPTRLLKTEGDREVFRSLGWELANKPRPRRPCPCGSARPLEDCHAQAEAQPYPGDVICPCGAMKIHAQCCVKRKDMYWVEQWDRRADRLQRECVPRVDTPLIHEAIAAKLSMSGDERQAFLRQHLDWNHRMLKDLAKSGRIDPAYAAAGCLVQFQPIWCVRFRLSWSENNRKTVRRGFTPCRRLNSIMRYVFGTRPLMFTLLPRSTAAGQQLLKMPPRLVHRGARYTPNARRPTAESLREGTT